MQETFERVTERHCGKLSTIAIWRNRGRRHPGKTTIDAPEGVSLQGAMAAIFHELLSVLKPSRQSPW